MIQIDMDMPDSCYDCCLNNYHFCDVTQTNIEKHWDEGTKPKDCPLKKDLEAAIEEIKTERDKSYACEAVGHGWGLQSALEIIQKHLGEEYEGY